MKIQLHRWLGVAVAWLGITSASAYDFQADGIYYKINNDGATVTVTNEYNGYGCSYTSEKIEIPSSVSYNGETYSVTSIASYAFSVCENLTSIVIPESVTTIEYFAFTGCTNLASITIPESVVNIGDNAFLGTAWYENQPDGLVYVNRVLYTYKGTMPENTHVNIDEGTVSIAECAFRGCTNLASVTIPETITKIGVEAFYGCKSLTSITIPNSITTLERSVFNSCTGLTSITIPNSITTLESYVFSYCTGLTSITIPESVTSIGGAAFYDCTGLTTVEWNIRNYTINNPYEAPFDGCINIDTFIFGENVEQIPAYICYGLSNLTSITIPESVTSIRSAAFLDCTGLTSVVWNARMYSNYIYNPIFASCPNIESFTFGDNVEFIPNSLCSGLTKLTSITIPESVIGIGGGAFSGCTGLTSVVWNVRMYSNYFDHIFASCPNIESFTFGDNVEFIPNYLCAGLTKLTSITIPESVTTIEDWAFSNCTGLTEVIIPNSVTTIGDYAFSGCTGLTEVIIPESVANIEDYAFSSCTGLTEVTIGKSVTTIGSWAFSGCDGLQSIVVAKGNTSYSSSEGVLFNKDKTVLIQCPGGKEGAYTIPKGVKTIGGQAFSAVVGLTSIIIPESVTTIEDWAFSYCTGLTEVIIPNSVTTIGDYAFSGCTGLTEVTIGKSVTTIGSWAFLGCDGLQSIVVTEENVSYSSSEGVLFNKDKTALIQYPGGKSGAYMIPSSVTSIEHYAFYNCTGLTSVTIPESVTSIGEMAFYNCTGLETIKSYATIPPAIETNTFSSYDATLYVPVDCGEAYREAEYWANFTNIVESIDSRVEALQDENIRVYTVDNTLHVENSGKVYQVYTLAGQLIYTGNGTTVPLTNTGVYIVHMGDYIQKVIVR